MNDDVLANLPAADLLQVVERVIDERGTFAGEAQLVVDEVLRLRDAGQLSKTLAGDLSSLIYQRSMHSWHSGDFQVSTPVRRLGDELNHHKRSSFPDIQVDPVRIHARVVNIAAGRVPPPLKGELGQGEQPDLVVAIARSIAAEVEPGWDSLRFEATLLGNVTTCITYVARPGKEERSSPPFAVADMLDDLKDALARSGKGTWISLTMVLTPSGGLTVEYNYGQDAIFGLGVTANDYSLELKLFPRDEASIPEWWRERVAQGDPSPASTHAPGLAKGNPSPTSEPTQNEVDHEVADLLTLIAREVDGSVSPGWDSLRYQVETVGNVTSDLIYVARGETEERVYAPDEMPERLLQLREAMYRADLGTWISLTMTLTSSGLMDVDYNYDEKPDFGFDVSAHDYALELQRFPRADESVPAWWRERMARGN